MKPAMSIERFETLLASYGARFELWPEGERDAARQLFESSPDAQRLVRVEADLDAAFAALEAPELSPELSRKLAELPALHAQPRRLWPFRRIWVPAVAWAAAAAFGVLLGSVALPEESAPTGEVAALGAAPDDGAAENFVDEEERELLEMALGPSFDWVEAP